MKKIMIWPVILYLRFFAKLSLSINKPKIIGITGSAGKSSTRNAIYAVLKDYFTVKMLEKGNSESGIPLAILGLSPINYSFVDWVRLMILAPFKIFYLKATKYIIVEMGVDEPNPPKNMGYLLSIIKPNISIFLNVFSAHILQFGSIDKIAAEKGKIITESGCDIGIYNANNFYVNEIISKLKIKNIKLLSFGKSNCDINYRDYKINEKETEFEFMVKNKLVNLHFNNYLLPQAYQEVMAAAILVGLQLELSLDQIKKSLEANFYLPKSRSSLLTGINNSIIIDSSYNASAGPTIAFLKMVKVIKDKTNRPVVFVFGDMRELGLKAEEEHKKVVNEALKVVDYFYCVGTLTKKYVYKTLHVIPLRQGFAGQARYNKIRDLQWFENSQLAGLYLKDNLPMNSLVLVKGSQNTIFLEEAVKAILKNKDDIKKLCRQEKFWIEIKRKLFIKVVSSK